MNLYITKSNICFVTDPTNNSFMSRVTVLPRSQSTDSFLLEGLDRASGDISPIGMIFEAKTSTI